MFFKQPLVILGRPIAFRDIGPWGVVGFQLILELFEFLVESVLLSLEGLQDVHNVIFLLVRSNFLHSFAVIGEVLGRNILVFVDFVRVATVEVLFRLAPTAPLELISSQANLLQRHVYVLPVLVATIH